MSIYVRAEIRFFRGVDGAQQQGPIAGSQMIGTNNDFGGNSGYVLVPGGDSPTKANIDTALTTIATNFQPFFDTTNLALIQNWKTGTG